MTYSFLIYCARLLQNFESNDFVSGSFGRLAVVHHSNDEGVACLRLGVLRGLSSQLPISRGLYYLLIHPRVTIAILRSRHPYVKDRRRLPPTGNMILDIDRRQPPIPPHAMPCNKSLGILIQTDLHRLPPKYLLGIHPSMSGKA